MEKWPVSGNNVLSLFFKLMKLVRFSHTFQQDKQSAAGGSPESSTYALVGDAGIPKHLRG